jgi:hypothetical protein
VRIYDGTKIIIGIIIFLLLITFPVWHNAMSGKTRYTPKPKIVTKEKQCIEQKQYMRDRHMDLLIDWRDTVVRNGIRTYVASNGKKYTMSLTATCINCHSNKAEFCDQCHNYAGVTPYCWDCHNYPKEAKK